ncbi:MAG: deoxyribodipyrimidine photo-lyase [Syntrophobacterales bacterium]
MNLKRVRTLKDGTRKKGQVVYWMSRDQRVEDNWALLYAQELAVQMKAPLAVVFCLVPQFLNATLRQFDFMLKGLKQVEKGLTDLKIPFFLIRGWPKKEIPNFASENKVALFVSDFDPLNIKKKWKEEVANSLKIPLYEVDTRNIVPCWIASPKQEYAAYTLRPKIRRSLPEFLEEFPKLQVHPFTWKGKVKSTNWKRVVGGLEVNGDVREVDWLEPGERAARQTLNRFLNKKLQEYDEKRNDPTKNSVSHLSPYLHFGQISAQRVALEVKKSQPKLEKKDSFLEELIVRRELSDNYCFYNEKYDQFEGFHPWAQKTLNEHRGDKREYLYSSEEFEEAKTHDDLWNAAQMEMVLKGKMHGYMRMYWAKKILEWTESPESALEIAIYLNDKYELDGRDSNGYAGIAWSVGGVHDRAWNERPVFGKIRYMSYNGCKRKFDIQSYIQKNLSYK